jgi:putative ABC transport system permease protein
LSRRVPLARRNTLAEPTRLAAAAGGVGLALMLILVLDGFWAGIESNITVYQDNVGADLYVAESGTRNLSGSTMSFVPDAAIGRVRDDPAVEWAAPVRIFMSIVEVHDRKVPATVIGFVPGERGGPWEIRAGRAPAADDEIAIGWVMARQHGLSIGTEIELLGQAFRVVGTTSDGFMASFIFMVHSATDELLRSTDTTSFILVGTGEPQAVRDRLSDTGFAVLDRDTLARNDLALMSRAFRVPIAVMRWVAFAIGSLVIALTAYSAIVERSREYGIVKAIGARGVDLLRVALGQSLIISVAGGLAGAVMFLFGRMAIETFRPQFAILVTPDSVVRAGAAVLMMALLASVVPARRLATLEPATAYRGG